MDTSSEEKLLRILIDNSRRLLDAGFGVDRAESAFVAVLELLREKPSLKSFFLQILGESFAMPDPWRLDGSMIPLELVEFAAFDLRWVEFHELAETRIMTRFNGDRSLAVGDLSMRVLSALRDDWEDRDLYKRYAENVE